MWQIKKKFSNFFRSSNQRPWEAVLLNLFNSAPHHKNRKIFARQFHATDAVNALKEFHLLKRRLCLLSRSIQPDARHQKTSSNSHFIIKAKVSFSFFTSNFSQCWKITLAKTGKCKW